MCKLRVVNCGLPRPDEMRMEQATPQHMDVELLFAQSPPTAGRESKLAASRRCARWAAAAASVVALAMALLTFAFL